MCYFRWPPQGTLNIRQTGSSPACVRRETTARGTHRFVKGCHFCLGPGGQVRHIVKTTFPWYSSEFADLQGKGQQELEETSSSKTAPVLNRAEIIIAPRCNFCAHMSHKRCQGCKSNGASHVPVRELRTLRQGPARAPGFNHRDFPLPLLILERSQSSSSSLQTSYILMEYFSLSTSC